MKTLETNAWMLDQPSTGECVVIERLDFIMFARLRANEVYYIGFEQKMIYVIAICLWLCFIPGFYPSY